MYIVFTEMGGTKRLVGIPEGKQWSLEHHMFDDEENGYGVLHLIIGTEDYVISSASDWMCGRPNLTDNKVMDHYDRLIVTVSEMLKAQDVRVLNLDEIEEELVADYGEEWKG